MLPVHFTFLFNDPATTEIYTLSLHDALPIYTLADHGAFDAAANPSKFPAGLFHICTGSYDFKNALETCRKLDRKSTRLNSSHTVISYAVFCLKKKKRFNPRTSTQS